MKGWLSQLAGTLLVLTVAAAVGGFVLVLRAQQGGLAATTAEAHIRAVSPPDGSVNVPSDGLIEADYLSRPITDPSIKLEPPSGVTLDAPHWEGTTFVIQYHGLRDSSLYHVELDQDSWQGKGEHRQIAVRWSFRTGSAHGQTPKPSATSLISPTPTPSASGTTSDLLWYRAYNPTGVMALNGLDWNGKPTKIVTKGGGSIQSPDGQRIYNSMTPSTQIYDVNGNVSGSIAGWSPSMWADDSQQFCGLTYYQVAPPHSLVIEPLDGTFHTVAMISLTDSANKPAQLSLVACSDLARRAIVTGASNGYIWSLAMISLTDGSIIYQTRYPNPVTRIVASHDGRYIAEQLAGNAAGGTRTLIRELPSGTIVGQVAGIVVEGFSWDGSLVAGGIPASTGLLMGAEVISWQSNKVIWNRCACPSTFEVKVIAQPGGTKLAVAATDANSRGTLTIVDANGAATSVGVGSQPFFPAF